MPFLSSGAHAEHRPPAESPVLNRKEHSSRRGLRSNKTVVSITVRAGAYTVEIPVTAIDPIRLLASQGIEPCILNGHFIRQFSVSGGEIECGVFLHLGVLSRRMNPCRYDRK